MTDSSTSYEATTSQYHLKLLRQEYVKLQGRLADTEIKLQTSLAASGQSQQIPLSLSTYVNDILAGMEAIFDQPLYSDLCICTSKGQTIKCHKFVLSVRGSYWCDGQPLDTSVDELVWEDIPYDVAWSLLQWVYTDKVDLKDSGESYVMSLLRSAGRFRLAGLKERCEQSLIAIVTSENCARLYQAAEDADAPELRAFCQTMILNYWDEIDNKESLKGLSAPLLYDLFKKKTEYPLHLAISYYREDVVFLYLIEFDRVLAERLSDVNEHGETALHIALATKQDTIAYTLLKHGCSIEIGCVSEIHDTYLHLAIRRGDAFSWIFLITNGANVNSRNSKSETPLQLASRDGLVDAVTSLLKAGANINLADEFGETPLHAAIANVHNDVVNHLLEVSEIDVNALDKAGNVPLWLAFSANDDHVIAESLVSGGADVSFSNDKGETLLHRAISGALNSTARFLILHNADLHIIDNIRNMTPLHYAAELGQTDIVSLLLARSPVNVPNVDQQTALILAVTNSHVGVVRAIIEGSDDLDVDARDNEDETAMGIAVRMELFEIAKMLLNANASVDSINKNGCSLTDLALHRRHEEGALFLLHHGTNVLACRSGATPSPLYLAIRNDLPKVVQAYCEAGAELDRETDDDNLLLLALSSKQVEIAKCLVKYQCNVNAVDSQGDTLLHRVVREGDVFATQFLLENGADIHIKDAVLDTALHISARLGLIDIAVLFLNLDNVDEINVRNSLGQTPLHVAIIKNQEAVAIALLGFMGIDLYVKDNNGDTPFDVALFKLDPVVTSVIAHKDQGTVQVVDESGRTCIHRAVLKNDVKTVIFLLKLNTDIDIRVQDADQFTPLHLATQKGFADVIQQLVLFGADINALDSKHRSPVHFAAIANEPSILEQFIQAGNCLINVPDEDSMTPLHHACFMLHTQIVRILLRQPDLRPYLRTKREETTLHLLSRHVSMIPFNGVADTNPFSNSNSSSDSVLCFDLLRTHPVYGVDVDLDACDVAGDTPLLLAYKNANETLAVHMVKAGCHPGMSNKERISILSPVGDPSSAVAKLQRKIVASIPAEFEWLEEDMCQGCNSKFSPLKRKHHCRHCGRCLCGDCTSENGSVRRYPIIKWDLTKPVRICDICYNVLSNPMAVRL